MSREEPDAFEDYSEGRDDERAEIVAWLRGLAIGNTSVDAAYIYAAGGIESGEHLRGRR